MTNLLQAVLYGSGLVLLIQGLKAVPGLPWWVMAPQGWLIVIALLVCWFLGKQRPSGHAILFALAYPLAVFLVSFWSFDAVTEATGTWEPAVDNWGREWEMDRTGLVSLMLMYAGLGLVLVFKPLREADFMGRGMFVILFAGEAYMWLENWLCNIAYPTAGSSIIAAKMLGEDRMYACSRVDWDMLVWLPSVVQILAMLWMAVMLKRARAKLS